MLVPGGDLLTMAMTLLNPMVVRLYRDIGRTTNAAGMDVTTFSDGEDVDGGSVQAVPRSRYEQYGFDVAKNYVTWYTTATVRGPQRDLSGDQIEALGRRWQIMDENTWTRIDGWTGVIGVDIGPVSELG